jgi:TRAP-type mannitol/chloroaromatic compound transport system substrate-binding protein
MRRRQFLSTIGAAGLSGASLASPAIAQAGPTVRWRCASSYPKSLDTVFGASEIVANTVSQMTGGRFQIQVFAAGEIVPAFGVLDAVSVQTVECGHTASFFYWGKEPAMAFDYTMPFGLDSRQTNAWYYYGGGRELVQEMMGEFGVRSFPCGNFGAQAGGWFRKEIRTPDDLKGLKMRIGGFSGAVFSKAGGVPQNIAAGDIYPALERGSIDAAEWVGPYDDEKLGFFRVAPHCYFPGWQEGSGQISFYVGNKAYGALPDEYKAALDAACAKAHVLTQAKYDHLNPQALRRLIAARAQFKFFSRDILATLYRATQETLDEQAGKSPRFRKILDSYRPYQSEMSRWWQISELGFNNYVAQALRGQP